MISGTPAPSLCGTSRYQGPHLLWTRDLEETRRVSVHTVIRGCTQLIHDTTQFTNLSLSHTHTHTHTHPQTHTHTNTHTHTPHTHTHPHTCTRTYTQNEGTANCVAGKLPILKTGLETCMCLPPGSFPAYLPCSFFLILPFR